MGKRGEGWVVAQFALLLLVLLAVLVPPDWPDTGRLLRWAAGAILVAVGVATAVAAARAMGRSLTPFPEPHPDATLVEHGPFTRVRHPVYAGALAILTGWSLFAGPVALALTAALALLWVGKIRAEERRLRARYAGYDAYAARVRWRLVPGIY